MAHLYTDDKRMIEKILDMRTGYILDFSNNRFAEFFSDNFGIDIYNGEYEFRGDSKANHLRAFWEKENDSFVGKVISKLLKYWRTSKIINGKEISNTEEQLYNECRKISDKLQGIVIDNDLPERSSYFPSENFALFISHRNEDKLLAKQIKDFIKHYGISSFVAHEDIMPSFEWIKEIEIALFSMDALLALLTKGFFKRPWTNQEIGVAYGEKKFILSAIIKEYPQGFISKFQAIKFNKEDNICDICMKIIGILLQNPKTSDKMIKIYFRTLENKKSFDESIKWGKALKYIDKVNKEQMDILIYSFNNNSQAYNCIGLHNYISEWIKDKKYQIRDKKIVLSE